MIYCLFSLFTSLFTSLSSSLNLDAHTHTHTHTHNNNNNRQHCGEIVSSRLAEEVCELVSMTCYENVTRDTTTSTNQDSSSSLNDFENEDPAFDLRRRVATLCNEDLSNTFLYPTGMASLTAAHRLLKLTSNWNQTPLRNIVFGFPYLDTLKLNSRKELGGGVLFFGRGDENDLNKLKTMLSNSDEKFGGLFLEFPSNPLLRAPPLRQLRELADEFDFPIILDDSISGFCNVDVLRQGGADVLCSSLTKQFSGSNTVMGGSLVLNSQSRYFDRFRSRLVRDHEDLLHRRDASALLDASYDLEARVRASNENAEEVVKLLQSRSDVVSRVYHPLTETKELYDEFKRETTGGYGALLSIQFEDDTKARMFYDRLDAAKGPGFGSNFTLVCPYTMIAHFNELDWCRSYGIDPNLVRVWVGLEERRELLSVFEAALDECGAIVDSGGGGDGDIKVC